MTENELLELSDVRQISRTGRARAVRIEAGLSQAEVAEACGTASSTVRYWETGARAPHGDAALRYGRLIRALADRATA